MGRHFFFYKNIFSSYSNIMVNPVLIGVIISGCISLANLLVSVLKTVKLKSACCKWLGCFEFESDPKNDCSSDTPPRTD